MNVGTRLRVLERQRRRETLVTCPQCHHAFPLEAHPAMLPPLPPFEGLRQLPYADLLRMYQERNRLDGTPAVRCPRYDERVLLPARPRTWPPGRRGTSGCGGCPTTSCSGWTSRVGGDEPAPPAEEPGAGAAARPGP